MLEIKSSNPQVGQSSSIIDHSSKAEIGTFEGRIGRICEVNGCELHSREVLVGSPRPLLTTLYRNRAGYKSLDRSRVPPDAIQTCQASQLPERNTPGTVSATHENLSAVITRLRSRPLSEQQRHRTRRLPSSIRLPVAYEIWGNESPSKLPEEIDEDYRHYSTHDDRDRFAHRLPDKEMNNNTGRE